ncbi:hypothetical protein V7247_27290 [Priestia megaterium]|uniref:hypothetical protein n=1 Tax=Priestia megaterium TaxID=1404 RepID=UPI003000B9B8
MSLKGKVAIITDSSGMGQSTELKSALDGVRVIVADFNERNVINSTIVKVEDGWISFNHTEIFSF